MRRVRQISSGGTGVVRCFVCAAAAWSFGGRPAVADYFVQRVREFAHFFQLIAAEQVHVFVVVMQVETDVPFPARRVVARQDRNATVDRALQRFAPFEPRARQRGAGAAESSVRHAPVHEG